MEKSVMGYGLAIILPSGNSLGKFIEPPFYPDFSRYMAQREFQTLHSTSGTTISGF